MPVAEPLHKRCLCLNCSILMRTISAEIKGMRFWKFEGTVDLSHFRAVPRREFQSSAAC